MEIVVTCLAQYYGCLRVLRMQHKEGAGAEIQFLKKDIASLDVSHDIAAISPLCRA